MLLPERYVVLMATFYMWANYHAKPLSLSFSLSLIIAHFTFVSAMSQFYFLGVFQAFINSCIACPLICYFVRDRQTDGQTHRERQTDRDGHTDRESLTKTEKNWTRKFNRTKRFNRSKFMRTKQFNRTKEVQQDKEIQ